MHVRLVLILLNRVFWNGRHPIYKEYDRVLADDPVHSDAGVYKISWYSIGTDLRFFTYMVNNYVILVFAKLPAANTFKVMCTMLWMGTPLTTIEHRRKLPGTSLVEQGNINRRIKTQRRFIVALRIWVYPCNYRRMSIARKARTHLWYVSTGGKLNPIDLGKAQGAQVARI